MSRSTYLILFFSFLALISTGFELALYILILPVVFPQCNDSEFVVKDNDDILLKINHTQGVYFCSKDVCAELETFQKQLTGLCDEGTALFSISPSGAPTCVPLHWGEVSPGIVYDGSIGVGSSSSPTEATIVTEGNQKDGIHARHRYPNEETGSTFTAASDSFGAFVEYVDDAGGTRVSFISLFSLPALLHSFLVPLILLIVKEKKCMVLKQVGRL